MENVNVLQENTIVQLQLRANRAIKIVSLAQVLAHLAYPAIPLLKESWK